MRHLSTKWTIIGLLSALTLLGSVAGASTGAHLDGSDVSGKLDIARIRHGHREGRLVHTITMTRAWRNRVLANGSYITVFITTDRDESEERTVAIDKQGGRLRADLYSCSECEGDAPLRSFIRSLPVTRPSDSQVRFSFRKGDLARRSIARYGWYVASSFISRSRSHACSRTAPCDDFAPDISDGRNYLFHRL